MYKTVRNTHSNETLKCSSLQNNLQDTKSLKSHPEGTLIYLIPNLMKHQIAQT